MQKSEDNQMKGRVAWTEAENKSLIDGIEKHGYVVESLVKLVPGRTK